MVPKGVIVSCHPRSIRSILGGAMMHLARRLPMAARTLVIIVGCGTSLAMVRIQLLVR